MDLSAAIHLAGADGIDPYVDHMQIKVYYQVASEPVFLQGGLDPVFGGEGLLLGDPSVRAQYWGYLLGSPIIQSAPQRQFIAGDATTAWGGGRFLHGAMSPYYGKGGYLKGTVTAIPYYPKPVAGSRFQRTESIIKEV